MSIFKYVPDNKVERTLHLTGEQDQSLSEVFPGPRELLSTLLLPFPYLSPWLPRAVLALVRLCLQALLWGLSYLRGASLELEINLEEKKRKLGE